MPKPSPMPTARALDSVTIEAESARRADLVVEHLTKRYPARKNAVAAPPAVDDVSFTVPPGTIFTVLGPSGGGKTTTLRCVAGLETPDTGDIQVGGRVLFSSTTGVSVPANRLVAYRNKATNRCVSLAASDKTLRTLPCPSGNSWPVAMVFQRQK